MVSTPHGLVQGVDRGASCAFLGVPYAAPPTGARRWKAPEPAAPWLSAPLNATSPPPACPALNQMTGLPQGNEDCLKLNVWTPDPPPGGPTPVIVWLHTGAFVAASANFGGSNGQRFAEQTGAIIVAPNYRLGPLGFLAHQALTGEDAAHASSGNYGLLDQRAALSWVRDAIAAFGGDAANVTLAGTSVGGLSVSLHLVSPGSADLFQRAVIQSGTATYRWRTLAEAEQQGGALAAALGCTNPDAALTLACLRSRTVAQVLQALPLGSDQILEGSRVQWGPVVDGVELPQQPRLAFEAGAFSRVPLIVGTNRDEGWPFVDRSFPGGLTHEEYEAVLETEFGPDAPAVQAMYPAANFGAPKDALARLVGDLEYVCEARRVVRFVERTGAPVYQYLFDYEVPAVAGTRVIHGLESNLLFGNNFGPPLPPHALTEADLALFRSMSGYWSRFASGGDPNIDDESVVHWPRYRHPIGAGRGPDKLLTFAAPILEAQRWREAACDFWNPFFLRSITGDVPASAP